MKNIFFVLGLILFLLILLPKNASSLSTTSNLNSYSLSFATIHNWWPTANNSVQQIDAAIWKDSDGENVKNFVNLKAEWKFDPNYYQMKDTSSNYFKECPIERVGKRPCINFTVHVITINPGKTNV
jgi:hypothetical protein